MKLYYSPALARWPSISCFARPTCLYELAKVDLWQHKTASGGDYFQINPKARRPPSSSKAAC
ncbi:hypothetical protein P4123_16525 [Pseudomonas aeruginosa]|nr:hypothetical protein [Pseudomonas aeruginosa]